MRVILFIGLMCSVLSVSAQQEKCFAHKLFLSQYQQNPERYDALESRVAKYVQQEHLKSEGSIITIPVVFHVVSNPLQAGSDLSEAILRSQIDQLNEDFRRRNDDTVRTRGIFKPIAADIQIEFKLATLGPDGLPTNGINRRQSYQNFNPFVFQDFVKYDSLGGINAWPAESYLNFWVCDMSLIAAQYVIGYAQFPGGDPATDGVVLQWQFVGQNTGDATNRGRTACHEVGHWLGLRHIWGDGDCSASDFVDDTPKSGEPNDYCLDTVNTCADEDPYWLGVNPPDMYENFMDYSADECLNAFTQGQKTRMHGFLYSDSTKVKLFESKGAGGPGSNAITESALQKIRIYPNPARDHITVSSLPANVSLQVMDITGKIMFQTQLRSLFDQVDISSLEPGFYVLGFTDKNGQKSQQNLIVE